MQRYDGQLIYSCRDADGVIDIVEEPTTRTMHFGTLARQTTMFRRDHQALALAYTRCMMSCLLFVEAPEGVLLLGLGGGSLAKFLLHHFPDCRIDGVEKRRKVVELAHAYFYLPRDPRLQIHVDAAEDFLRRRGDGSYDLILVDLHGPDGMAPAVGEPDFFARCRQQLRERGILSINLWSGDQQEVVQKVTARLQTCFSRQTLQLPVAGKSNTVALGFNFPIPADGWKRARRRANELEASQGMEFSRFLWELARFNRRSL